MIDFEPATLEAAAKYIEKLRTDFLFGGADDPGAPNLLAEQYFLLALSALEQAEHNMKLASYHQARENTEAHKQRSPR